jgi:hypothetical protein
MHIRPYMKSASSALTVLSAWLHPGRATFPTVTFSTTATLSGLVNGWTVEVSEEERGLAGESY